MGFFSTILERRAAATTGGDPRNPAYWLQRLFGGGASRAGIDVNEASALSASDVFACVRAIAEDTAKLPLKVYESDGKDRHELPDHPLRRLLDVEPNPEMSALDLRQAIVAMALLYGSGYAEIERDGAGRPFRLWPLHPKRVEPKRASGVLFYSVTQNNGTAISIAAADMYHLKGFGGDGVKGFMVLELGKEAIGLSLACERFAASFFGNGAMPGGVFTHPKVMGKDAREAFKAEWNDMYKGVDNSHRIAVFEEGMAYTATQVEPEAAQFLETRQFNVETTARWFRMPPHKIQHLARATFSNIEHQSQEYVTDTLMAWLTRLEKEGQRKLLMSHEAKLFLKHNVAALLRGDSAARAAYYNTMSTLGAININEIRGNEDMNAIEGGDRHLVQRNMVPLDRLDEVIEAEKAKATINDPKPPGAADQGKRLHQLAEQHAKLLADCYRRILRVEVDRVRKESKKPTFATWAKDFYADHGLYVRGGIGAAVEACAGSAWVMLREDEIPAAVQAQIAEMAKTLAARHVSSSQAGIAAGVEGSLTIWEASRADGDAAAAAKEIVELITNLAKEKP